MPAWLLYCIKHVVLVIATLLLITLLKFSVFSSDMLSSIIVLLAAGKTIYFVRQSYLKIVEVSRQNTPYYQFMRFIALNIILVIFSFGLDYWCLTQVNPKSFVGFQPEESPFEIFFDCFYFSTLNFTVFGFGELMPRTVYSKLLVLMEVCISFLTFLFILSDFISLKESLQKQDSSAPKK
jgi:hypothetical protein